jgi:hypothetical protein
MSVEKIETLILSDENNARIGSVLLNHSLYKDECNGLKILAKILEQFKTIIKGENIYLKKEIVEKLEILLDEIKSDTAIHMIESTIANTPITPATVVVYDQYSKLINKKRRALT